MDQSSITIDRHTPIIPESIWFGFDPSIERIFTRVKNRLILPASIVRRVTKRDDPKPQFANEDPRRITDEMLEKAALAVDACFGFLDSSLKEYLNNRGVTTKEIDDWRMCQTSILLENLDETTIDNLTLRIPAKFKNVVKSRDINGISIPYYRSGKLCGFVTRVIGEDLLKYCVSVPHRLCFGLNDKSSDVFVVEGVFDAIALRHIGCNALGMADSQPNYYKMMVANQFDIINLVFDPDYAGWLGTIKAYIILTEMFRRDPTTINIFQLEDGDPELLIRRLGELPFRKITLEEAIEQANRECDG